MIRNLQARGPIVCASVCHTHILNTCKQAQTHSQHRIPFQFCEIAEKIHRCWIKYKQIWICIWIRIHCSATFKTHHISPDYIFYSLSISRLSGAPLKGELYFFFAFYYRNFWRFFLSNSIFTCFELIITTERRLKKEQNGCWKKNRSAV